MAAPLYLRCLGAPGLYTAGGAPIRFKVRKHLALLVYLAIEPRARHARDALAALLWPRVPAREARHSLATALTVLRGVLGADVLDASRDFVRLPPGALDLDLDRLAAGDVLASDHRPALPVAGFLEELEVPDAAEFMLWRERQRARLLPQVRDALVVQMDRCRRTGDWAGIEPLADTLLRLDELNEDAVRAKMEARAFVGDRISALKLYEGWRAQVYEELGAAPAPHLEQLAQRLRRRGIERPLLDLPAVQTARWHDQPFVGRAAEYQQLYEGWERMRRGEPGHVLVTGLAGVGKTTLVERFTTAVALEGAVVVRVQGHELERELPYAVLAELVRQLLDRPGAAATSPEALAELGRVVPEVRRRYPATTNAEPPSQASCTIKTVTALVELICAVADESPVVIALDNAHLVDAESAQTLFPAIRRTVSSNVLAVIVLRTVHAKPSAVDVRYSEFASWPQVRDLALQRFALDDALTLAEHISEQHGRPSRATLTLLALASGGLPALLTRLISDWAYLGKAALPMSPAAIDLPHEDSSSTERYVASVLSNWHGSLDESSLRVLQVASALGHRLDELALYTLGGIEPDAALFGLGQLYRAGLLTDSPEGVLTFPSEAHRQLCYRSAPRVFRQELHRRIALQLEKNVDWHDSRSLLDLAWHWLMSPEPRRAERPLLAGARRSLLRGASMEAQIALDAALPRISAEAAAEALCLLAQAMQEGGRWLDADALLTHSDAEPRHEYKCARLRSETALDRHDEQSLRTAVLELFSAPTNSTSIIDAARTAAFVAHHTSDCAIPHAAVESLSIHDKCEGFDVDEQLALSMWRAQLAFHLGRRDEARGRLQELQASLGRLPLGADLRSRILTGLAIIDASDGNYEDAFAKQLSAHQAAVAGAADPLRRTCAANLAIFSLRLGRFPDTLKWTDQLCRDGDHAWTWPDQAAAQPKACIALAYLRRHDESLAIARSLLQRATHCAAGWRKASLLLDLADAMLLVGRSSEALGMARDALAHVPTLGSARRIVGPVLRWTALLSEADGSRRRMEIVRKDLLEMAERLDAIDLVQASAALNSNGMLPDERYWQSLLAQATRRLPRATLSQIVSLGFPEADALWARP